MDRVVVFPGQGSQAVGMADAWLEHPAARAVLERASDVLGRDVVAGCRDEGALATTAFVQPALLACGVAAFRVLEDEGATEWAGAAGHSLGEFAALVAADVLSFEDALEVVRVRGEAMQRAGEAQPGGMAALLGIDAQEAEALCVEARDGEVLVVANLNSPGQVVVSGSLRALDRLEGLAAARRLRAVRLQVAGAFHSPLMEPAAAEIRAALEPVSLRPPRFPIAENVVGRLVTDVGELRELLVRQVVSPVRWADCVGALVAAGATTIVEAGPGGVLTRLQKRIDPGVRAVAVASPDAARTFVAAG